MQCLWDVRILFSRNRLCDRELLVEHHIDTFGAVRWHRDVCWGRDAVVFSLRVLGRSLLDFLFVGFRLLHGPLLLRFILSRKEKQRIAVLQRESMYERAVHVGNLHAVRLFEY